MNRDVVVGIVGAVALVLVMGGVFAYEYVNYNAGPLEETTAVQTESQTLAEGAIHDFNFEVNGVDLGRLEVLLEWTDDVGNNDQFKVTLIDDEGNQVATKTGATGSLKLSHLIAEAPENGVMPDAWQGERSWTVRVELVAAPGESGAVEQIEQLNTADGAQAMTLTLTEVRFQAAA